MTNLTVVMIYSPLFLMTAIALMGSYQALRKQRASRSLLFLVCMLFGWQIFEILYFTTESAGLARIFVDLRLPFIAFCVVGLLFFTLRLYRLNVRITKLMYLAICLVPIITAVLAVTSPMHNWIREELLILTDGPVHRQINVRGAWFWVHTAYSNFITGLTFVIVLYQHRKLPKEHRLPSTIMMISIVLAVFCTTATVTGVWQYPISLTLIGNSIAIIMIYTVVMRRNQMDFLMLARKEIFDFLQEGILVIDSQNVIIEKNTAARGWMKQMGLEEEVQHQTLDTVVEHLKQRGAVFRRGIEDDEGIDIELTNGESKVVYSVHFQNIYDKTGHLLGKFATCEDVTSNRQLIDRLERHAGIDVLTGLPNRRSFDVAMAELDNPASFPLAVLLGDLNNLKQVNDEMGHKQGDMLLVETAERLGKCCPNGGRLFRIGGDEFVMLLPNCEKAQVSTLITKINAKMAKASVHGFVPSIALGYAIKEHTGQDLDNLLGIADRNMYMRKREHYRRKQTPGTIV